MTDTLPEPSGLALGKLIGTVESLVKTVETQNTAFIKAIDDQNKLTLKNRDDFMDIFKGIRDDNKDFAVKMETHVKDDGDVHSIVLELKKWKDTAAAKVDQLWDFHQQNKGFLTATRLLTASVGGLAVAVAEHYWK
jgi:excinuclease UvrABC nuclease subunit